MAQRFKVTHDSPLLEYLFGIFPDQSRTSVKAYLRDDRIVVNGENRTAFDWPLRTGDTLEVLSKGASIGRDMKIGAREALQRQGITIVFEDEHIIVIDKNAGVPSISTRSQKSEGREKSAYSLLTDYMHTEKRANIKAGTGAYRDSSRVFVVHRLDRDTSGLLLFAKDERTKDLLQSKWQELVLERTYTAILEGHPKERQGTIQSWLTENEKSMKMSSSPVDNGGMRAVTRFEVIEDTSRYSKVLFELETGRKNQIRVHAADVLGHPIVGDRKYGASTSFNGRIALHAGRLVFRNPYGGKVESFESPLPDSFKKLK